MLDKYLLFKKIIQFILIVELSCGYLYFQRSWDCGVATYWVYSRLVSYFGYEKIVKTSMPMEKYEIDFNSWILELNKQDVLVAILYIPMNNSKTNSKRSFFKSIVEKQGIDFIDVHELLENYENDWIYNLPNDTHLTRLGHKLVANYLQKWVEKKDSNLKKTIERINLKNLRGPHSIFVDQVRIYNGLTYHIKTNNKGFRMSNPLKQTIKQTVLILGDSFTFGTGVDTEEAYPNLLNNFFSDTVVINGGVPGAGLKEELRVYKNFVAGMHPQVVILQVLDNDIE